MITRKISRGWLLIIFACLGIIFIGFELLIEHWSIEGHWFTKLFGHIGMAFIISSLVGVTIDSWHARELVSDVFKGSVGYLLPKEFQDHIRLLLDQKFLCISHKQTVEINRYPALGGETAVITTIIRRKFQNITNKRQRLNLGLGVDDWLIDGIPSEILEFSYRHGSKTVRLNSDKINIRSAKKSSPTLCIMDGIFVDVEKDETVEVWFEYRESHHINGSVHVHFTYPTREPEVSVSAGPDISWSVHFPFEGEFEKVLLEKGSYRYRGVIFPAQEIRISFWDQDAARDWLERK